MHSNAKPFSLIFKMDGTKNMALNQIGRWEHRAKRRIWAVSHSKSKHYYGNSWGWERGAFRGGKEGDPDSRLEMKLGKGEVGNWEKLGEGC